MAIDLRTWAQALLPWLHPDGQYPTDSPRARRTRQIALAMDEDRVVRLDRDPEYDGRAVLSC
ncbi:MAG TPA: hypothetical protein VG370_10285 [Chloroflexota bacterium]|nr:hypothetical protein [Chloroflexota bacterium]